MRSFRKVVSIVLVFVYLFTALPFTLPSNTGGIRVFAEEGMTDWEAVYKDIEDLDALAMTEDWQNSGGINTDKITLPVLGANGSTITWASSHEELVGTDGTINIPSYSTFIYYYGGYSTVELVATVSKGEAQTDKYYYINITSGLEETEEDQKAIEDYDYVYDIIWSEGWDDWEGYQGDHFDFPATLPNGSTISWSSENPDVIASDGTINRPPKGEGDQLVAVSFLITRGPAVKLKGGFSVKILEGSYAEDLESDMAWLTEEMILDGNGTDEVRGRLNLPTSGPKNSTITWTFSEEGYIIPTGAVMRPTEAEGDKIITLTATFLRGAVTGTKTFEFTIKASSSEEEESLLEADAYWIENDFFHYKNLNDFRLSYLELPVSSLNGSTISWVSSDPDVISVAGEVTHPEFSRYKGYAVVTLTATVSRRGGLTAVIEKEVWVYPEAPTDLDRVVYCKENYLTDDIILHGNDPSYVKTNLSLPTSNSGQYYRNIINIGGCTISWESSNPDVIAADGTVTRPQKGQPSVEVTLTATISFGEATDTKSFTFIVTPTEEYPLAINYDDFNNTDRLQFNGGSGIVDTTNRNEESVTALKFSNGTGSTGGSVFTKNRIRLGDDLSFSTAFTFRINNLTDYYDLEKSGAFTFTLQGTGSSVYPQGLNDTAIKPSLNIAFTTSRSQRGSGQAYSNYVDVYAQVFYNGDYSNATEKYRIGTFRANEQMDYHTIWIEYDGTQKVLELWFSTDGDRPDINYMHLWVGNVDLGEILRGAGDGLTLEDVRDVYAGFMGSMGDAREDIEIYDWYFKNDSTPINKKIYDFYDVSNITLSAVASEEMLKSILTVTVSGVTGPMAGIPVEFHTDFGTFLGQPVIETDASGKATITLSGEHTGVAHVKAIAPGGAMAEVDAPLSATDADSVNFDVDWLVNGAGRTLLMNGNSSLDNILTALNLPSASPNGSDITWSSNSPYVNAANGNVILPTPEEGNQQVILTATLSKGTASRTEQITIIVRFTDASAVPADKTWLDTVILKENSSWDNIIGDLNMLSSGQYGSSIIWASSNENFIAANGTVTRPTYTQGDQTVTLTASITKGSSSDTVSYTATVRALDPNDLEAVDISFNWLTWDIIKNGNTDMDSVADDLDLPDEGPWNTAISWTSSNTNVVAINGDVVQPAFSQGKKKITLTADISRGEMSVQKTFEITVLTLPQTDAEAVEADKNWLDISRTLGQNLSEFSIKENLSLPNTAPNGSAITWSSDTPAFILDDGRVIRPTSVQGHKAVNLTAVFRKGSAEETKVFTYTVLAEPDVTPPQIVNMDVRKNGVQIACYDFPFDVPVLPWLTTRISIEFDEVLEYWPGSSPGIRMESPGATPVWGKTWNNEVIFDIIGLLNPGAVYEIIIPSHYVGDVYGNMPAGEIRIPVRVEERPYRTIQVISSTPADREREVSRGLSSVTLKFNYSDIKWVENNYRFIKVVNKYGVPINKGTPSLSGDEVVIDLNNTLEYDMTYRVIIPAGTFTDYYENQNPEQIIQFRSESYKLLPVIEDVYPRSGQTDVDIHQKIYVTFKEPTSLFYVELWLRDETGQNVPVATRDSMAGNRKIYSLIPYEPLKPDTVYTVYGKHYSELDPSQSEISHTFRTGENKLGIRSMSPEDRGMDIPIDKAVEIEFSAPPMKGPAFPEIEFTDSDGNPVSFSGVEMGNKALFIPDADYDEEKVYFIRIPKGAYQGQSDIINDEYIFRFKTDKKLELESNFLNVPSSGLVGKTVRFNADRIEKWIKSENHGVVSYQWDFADGNSGSVTNPEHIFSQPGDYLIKLTVLDNKGFYYEFEQNISILPIQDVKMIVNRNGSSDLYIAQGWSIPSRTYNVRLECENLFVPGERINAALYKNGNLIKTYDELTSGANNEYTFVFTPESNYLGSYQLVFTYNSPAGVMTVRDSLRITASNATSYLRVQLYDRRNGEIYSEAEYLNVKVEGQSKVAVREWIPSLNEYVYTVQEQFPILRYYKFQLEGFNEHGSDQRIADYSNSYGILYNIGELGDFYTRPPLKMGYRPNFGLNKLVDTSVLTNFYIEGVDVGTRSFAVEGNWNGMTPGYYELTTTSGKMHKTSTSYRFELRPGTDFKAGDQLMMRMVSKNGVSSNWAYWDLNVLPKPKIMGVTVDVRYQYGYYTMTLATPFGEIMGGAIEPLEDIPYLGEAEFGLGRGMPSFTGIIHEPININRRILAEADISGEFAHNQMNKTKDYVYFKNGKLKKVKTIGYEVEIEVDGRFRLFWDEASRQWKMEYMSIHVGGWGEKSWSKGLELVPGVGIKGTIALDAYVGGTLIVDNQNGSSTKYSGIIEFNPGLEVSVSGSVGVAAAGGGISANLPAELHIPTGYFEVGLDVNAYIWYRILLHKETPIDERLIGIRWNNGRPKIVLKMAGSIDLSDEEEPSSAGSGFKLMDRNYLNRESVWLGGNATSSMQRAGAALRGSSLYASGTSAPESGALMSNIFPDAEVQMVQMGDELWLVWNDDNPERDAINRTQLRYSVFENGTWSEPAWLDNDRTADFSPALASAPDGILMAWHDISKEIGDEEDLRGMLENSAISVTSSPFVYGGTFETVTFPNDGNIDHSPRLAADGNNALMVWTRSEGLGFSLGEDMEDLKAPANSDSLLFSRWNGSSWSTPLVVQSSLATVMETNLTMNGNQGLLLYTLSMSMDNDDRELFAVLFDGSRWGEPIRITNNDQDEINPKAAYINGDWFITWVQDGIIQYKEGLNSQTRTWEMEASMQYDYQLAVLDGAYPQAALVYKRTSNDLAQNLYAVFYDLEAGMWSGEILLTEEDGYIQKFEPMFTDDGKLTAAYTQAEIITEAIPVKIDGDDKIVETSKISDKVDLKVMTYTPLHDMAFDEEEGLLLSSVVPLPEAMITVFAGVVNQGDFAERVIVDLYDGNPKAGGVKVASSDELTIPARSYVGVEMEWLVPSGERDAYYLYAVIRPQRGIIEKDENNNTISLVIQSANVYVGDLVCENVAKKDYILDAVIINDGTKTINDMTIKLVHADSGEVVKSESLRKLEPGQEFPVSMLFSAQGLEEDENGNINMVLMVVHPEGVNERSTEDNVWDFALVSATIYVNSGYPSPDETKVPVDSTITLVFNLQVKEGAGFNGIILEDEDLNVIEILKTIDGDTLTITPADPLTNDTQYTLTVPANAIGDDYGHTMAKSYTMSFTTTSRYPEVAFAWPAYRLDETAVDTEIRLMFNQDISQGPTYNNIKLYGKNNLQIPVSVSIRENSWLYIRPAAVFSGNTTYSLVVPRGAVANGDKALLEDFGLTFTTSNTGGNDDNSGGNNPGGNSNNNSGVPKPTDSYSANIGANGSMQNINLPVKVDSNSGKASVDLAKLDEEIFAADENIVISVPSIPGVNAYTLEIQAASLSDDDGKGTITFETAVGSITFGPDMLSGMTGLEGKTAGINIAAGDKTGLPDEIREAIGDCPLIQLTLTLDGKQIDWNNPSAPVTVTIPYTPSQEELANPECIVIWYVDGSGRAVSVPNSRYDPVSKTVTFTTTHFSDFAVVYYPVSFNDVAPDAWYKKAVGFIASRQITSGTGNGNYSPNAIITRGEFITLLMRAYEIAPDKNPADNFTDAGNTYYTGYLAAARRLGISYGTGNNMFSPNKEITRQEMFTMLYNALKAINKLPQGSSGKTLDVFTDTNEINSWAKESFTLLVETGTVVGNDGKLTPNGKATRAQIAQILYSLLAK